MKKDILDMSYGRRDHAIAEGFSMFLKDSPRPLLFAHRGCSAKAPENSLTAFKLARELGIGGIELDIQLCKSGEIVVFHDSDLKRLAGRSDFIRSLTYREIKEVDIGSWKDKKFKGERIPLLEDVFNLLGDDVYYDIEIKDLGRQRTGIERALIRLIHRYQLEERIIISSFNPFPLARLRPLWDRPKALIYSKAKEVPFYLRRGEGRYYARSTILKPHFSQIPQAPYKRSWFNSKLPLIPWTVNDRDLAQRLLDFGVEGLISDKPEILIPLVSEWIH